MGMSSVTPRSPVLRPDGRKRASSFARESGPEALDSRFDRRLAIVLQHAAHIFCEKGYEGASMRDLSRAAGMSLAGLYHYCESKEELLYLIQKHTFRTIIERLDARLKDRLKDAADPEQRIRIFIENHL